MLPLMVQPRSSTSLGAAMAPYYRRAVDVVMMLQRRYAADIYAQAKAATAASNRDAAADSDAMRFGASAHRPAAPGLDSIMDDIGEAVIDLLVPFAEHLNF